MTRYKKAGVALEKYPVLRLPILVKEPQKQVMPGQWRNIDTVIENRLYLGK
jgi:hypothetical protein